jgi:hypothetical protein
MRTTGLRISGYLLANGENPHLSGWANRLFLKVLAVLMHRADGRLFKQYYYSQRCSIFVGCTVSAAEHFWDLLPLFQHHDHMCMEHCALQHTNYTA